MKNTLKSIGAVLAGFLAVAILSVLTDTLLEKVRILPPPDQGLYDTGLLLLALFYRTVYTVVGGYITAMLAPNKPMKHVIALAVLGTVAGTLAVTQTWGKGLGPEWYSIGIVVLGFPSIWLGGKLRVKA